MLKLAPALVVSTAFAFKNDLTLVPSTTESASNLLPGYSLESQYWVRTWGLDSNYLILSLTTEVPYDEVQDGNIV